LTDISSENKAYIDLERLDNRELFSQKNYDNIIHELEARGLLRKEKMYLAIDEIQMLPSAPSILKYLHDTFDVKFIVTGSSSYYLKNLFSESMAGRKKIFELYPLDFGEYLDFQKIFFRKDEKWENKKFNASEYERVRHYYEKYIEFGGFPEVVLAKSDEERRDLLSDIVSSYVNIDIKSLADFRNEKNIFNLMKMLSSRIGTKLDYSKLSRLSGLSRPTVTNYIDFFEKTYLLERVPVMSKNFDREIVKAQKLYFCDNGIAGFLTDLSGGSKFENAVFNQLRHFGKLQYFSLKNGREIDFILDDKIGLEVKESPTPQDQNKLNALCEDAQIPDGHLIGRNNVPNFSDFIWGGEIR
jgi:predicted AAA+ superfamily ATPase